MAEAAAMIGCPAAIVEMIQAKEIVLALLKKYRDREMDLADACIVRMTELMSDCRVITLNHHPGASRHPSWPGGNEIWGQTHCCPVRSRIDSID